MREFGAMQSSAESFLLFLSSVSLVSCNRVVLPFVDLPFPSTNVRQQAPRHPPYYVFSDGQPAVPTRLHIYTRQPRPPVQIAFPGFTVDVISRPDADRVPTSSALLTPAALPPSVFAAMFKPSVTDKVPVKVQPATTTTTTSTTAPSREPSHLPEDQFQCGFRDVDLICGLTNTVCIGEFPWLAMLVKKSPPAPTLRQRNFCTGVLVHPRFVLAAENCVKDLDFVRFREHHLDNRTDCSPGIVKTCGESVDVTVWRSIHSHKSIPVALVEFPSSVSDNEEFKVFPACLPSEELSRTVLSERGAKIPLITAGWGTALPHAANYNQDALVRQAKARLVACNGSNNSAVICVEEPLDWHKRCVVDPGAPLLAVSAITDPAFDVPLFSVLGIDTAEVGPRPCSLENERREFYYVPSFADWISEIIS